MKTIIVSPEASTDLDYYCDYISQNNSDAALNFFDAARSTFVSLAQMPSMGQLYDPNNPRLENLRKWRVKGFQNYLIFYRVTTESIVILRVVNGSQDLDRIFEADDPS